MAPVFQGVDLCVIIRGTKGNRVTHMALLLVEGYLGSLERQIPGFSGTPGVPGVWGGGGGNMEW